ncbi:hypothetical protein CHS0354_032896 [Potamilus streckersoni]|uniref:NACHT domain-containing protein n=1 Tax=Potamilus streckersoni TaxID=2493646 RepID=A0AAE0RWZ6_9BIVA|nr:hypothetical protein CHS0354_032896 [Potamilus streckersoni]
MKRSAICESEDANLLFPNTPTSYAGDIKAKTWNKDNGIRLASWMASTDFITHPSYSDRLMPIGENSIKIRNATRNDTGFYTLVQTSGSTQNFFKSTLYLEVLVPPTNQCIPNITLEGNSLQAILPLGGCGIPKLTPNWTSGTQKLISDRISVLDLTSETKTELYIACAVGSSKRCIQIDSCNLCTNYTVSEPQVQDNSNTRLNLWWIPVPIILIIIIKSVACLLCYKWIKKKNKYPARRDDGGANNETGAGTALIDLELDELGRTVPEKETFSIIGVTELRRHLIGQYKTTKSVAISPCQEENHVDVSHIYCELEIMSLGTGDDDVRENVTTASVLRSSIGEENFRPTPVMIIGECGSGKTTWCKNLVHQWCQYHDKKESKLSTDDSSIPDIARRYIVEHADSVLLLIDGLDEVTCSLEPVVNLLKEDETFSISIVLASRPSGLECLQEKVGRSLRLFEIHGMSLESSKKYARIVLDMLRETHGEKRNIDQFWKFANNIQVLSMCHIPLLCLSLIFIWTENKAITADLANVLLTIVEYYLQRTMTREWFKVNMGKVLEKQTFDISGFIAMRKNPQYLGDHGYLLKVISGIAQNLWYVQMDGEIDKKSIEMETKTMDSKNDVKYCLETGILLTTFRGKLDRTRSQVVFCHPLFFDLFAALSITMGNGESLRKCITTKKAVVQNICMIHMLCQVAPNVVKDMIKDISKIFEKDNENYKNEKTLESEPKLICNIECSDPKLQRGAPVKWLKTLMYMDELNNAKLSLLTEGLKFTKDLTVFLLHLSENKNELVFRLPILSKLQALQVDTEHGTLLLDEEQKWKNGKFSELGELVIRSVNIDVETTGHIIESVSTCKHLRTLELCPNDESDTDILPLGSKKTFYDGWVHLAEGIKNMTSLSTFRLHNLQIREYLPALLESLCRCPTIEMLDLMNLNEIDTEKNIKVNSKDQHLYGGNHQEAKQSENLKILKTIRNETGNTIQLTKNSMSEKSWSALSAQLEYLSPRIVHIEQVHQSSRVVNEVLQGIGRCKNLKVLVLCNIHTGNHPVSFFSLRQLHMLTKFTISKITMPDSSWKELSDILARLPKLEELSLADLEIKNCFIDVYKASNVKLLELREVHLEDGLWSKVVDLVMTLPNLETLKLVSCKMSKKAPLIFSNKMNRSIFHVEMERKSKVTDSEMVSIDMIVTSKRKLINQTIE